MSKSRNYYIKFDYKQFMMLTSLLKPIQRDIYFMLMCMRAVQVSGGGRIDALTLNNFRKQYYRGLRKDAFDKYFQPMVDQGLIICNKFDGKFDITTQMNEAIEIDLLQKAKAKQQRDQLKKPVLKQNGSVNNLASKSNALRALSGIVPAYKDRDIDK